MLDVIRKRRSVRAYLTDDVDDEKLREVLKAAMFSPTSHGRRPWDFIVIRNKAMKTALSEATLFASFIKDAPIVIVICYNIDLGRRFKEDSSICAEHIYLEAVNQGLGSCFVQIADAEGTHGNPEDYVKKLLGIPHRFRVQCLMPVGYPSQDLVEHSDREFEETKIHYEKFRG